MHAHQPQSELGRHLTKKEGQTHINPEMGSPKGRRGRWNDKRRPRFSVRLARRSAAERESRYDPRSLSRSLDLGRAHKIGFETVKWNSSPFPKSIFALVRRRTHVPDAPLSNRFIQGCVSFFESEVENSRARSAPFQQSRATSTHPCWRTTAPRTATPARPNAKKS